MSVGLVVALSVAGAAGAVSRFVVDDLVGRRLGRRFPWATLVINVTGSLLLGLLTGLVRHHGAPTSLTTVAGTGFCGGFTTFSTAAVETVRLLQDRRWRDAAAYAAGGQLVTVLAAALGLALTA